MLELLTDLSNFLVLFIADFLAVAIYDFTKTLTMKGVSALAFQKGGDYYYISFLHERARTNGREDTRRVAQIKAAVKVNIEQLQFNWQLGRDLVIRKAKRSGARELWSS